MKRKRAKQFDLPSRDLNPQFVVIKVKNVDPLFWVN